MKGGFLEFGADKAEVEKTVASRLYGIVSRLEPPKDWATRSADVLKLNLELYRGVTFYGNALSGLLRDDSQQAFDELYLQMTEFFFGNIVSIVGRIGELSERERVELLMSSEGVYADPIDAWNLEDLTARFQVFRFFYKPTDKELARHKMHEDKMSESFKRAELKE